MIQTDIFKQYIEERKGFENEISIMNSKIEEQKKELGNETIGILKKYSLVLHKIEMPIYVGFIISLIASILYIVYLKKWHPCRWTLSTSCKTFSFLKQKILRNNGLLPLIIVALLMGVATAAKAKTNVLQDINMYYAGNQFEKGYLLCKYSKKPFTLDYTAVNNIPVIKQPGPGFERAYDMVAHLIGLHLSVSAGELAWLYDRADNDAQRRMVFELLVQLPKDAVQAAAEKVIDSICDQGRRQVGVSIDRFNMLLAALAGSDNRLLANGLVKTFLAKAVSQIRDLEGLDALVGLAVANDAFETLREPTAKVLKTIPSRLSFSDTVYAARVYFRIDKDMSRKLFNDIRLDFRKFVESPVLTQKMVELMQELSGVAAFRPIYDTDSLYKSLQQQPNALRVQITSLLDSVDTSLAGVAYNSIGHDAGDLVFRDPKVLRLFADMTAKYNKNGNGDIVNALARAVVEFNVPYTKDDVFKAAGLMGEKPEAFAESVFTYDMSTDFKFNRNGKLFLSLVTVLTPQQIKAFEDYFAKKTSLANGLLIVLFQKDKTAFYKLLEHVFANAPQSIADLRLPNETFDLRGVAPAFSAQALKGFETLPAPVLFAQHELAGSDPDIKLVRRALIPELDRLFRDFLTNEPKSLTEEQAIETLILLSIVAEPGGVAFKEEQFVLNKLAQDYFSGAVANGNAMLRQAVAEREKALSLLQKAVSLKNSAIRLEIASRIYSGLIMLYLFLGAALSLFFACNVLLPGKNFSLVNGTLHWMESFACYLMATVIGLVPGFCLKVSTQFLRGLLVTETVTPTLEACVAALDAQSPIVEKKAKAA
ncbi:hypothetical protein [Solidesulfovibrio sp. C21]|uniref:hypothetical protein n=1 Tax=Solidesulfovibrio sp. C21 TaxID=3398613 RepID=UPI0039FCA457